MFSDSRSDLAHSAQFQMVGLGFSSRGDEVVIKTVKGLLESSLLNTGDVVVSINNGPSPRNGKDIVNRLGVVSLTISEQPAKPKK